ncbi:MAG: hypothetical protein Q8O27_00160 [Enterobacteriaceae bacterium]|nr:hypothetical protein [Enterobacteriaceae bacterium]
MLIFIIIYICTNNKDCNATNVLVKKGYNSEKIIYQNKYNNLIYIKCKNFILKNINLKIYKSKLIKYNKEKVIIIGNIEIVSENIFLSSNLVVIYIKKKLLIIVK